MAIHPYFKRPSVKQGVAATLNESWKIRDLCSAYKWPTNAKGGGVIGIIEMGGAYLDSDTAMFCNENKIPLPHVSHVYLDGMKQTNMQDDASGEVALDIQIVAAAYSIATGHMATIRIYWCQDMARGVNQAAADGCDTISISWGMDEAEWGQSALLNMESQCRGATSQGMIIFAASGDNDSGDGGNTLANVDGPASCIHVIGCGGTRRVHNAEIETVWNDNPGESNGEGTGGGYSTIFPVQSWQAGAAQGPGRMVPDVAANADPETGYEIIINGRGEAIGGTSAVAPLYAGLFAAFGKKLGWIAPKLWLNHTAFHLITQGNNGMFRAGSQPSPTCGLGSPIGDKLIKLFL